MDKRIAFFEKWLFRYLIGYWLVHLLVILFLVIFERGWGGFLYLLIFWAHLPFFLVGTVLAFVAKRKPRPWIWCLSLLFFFLSNGYWVNEILDNNSYLTTYIWFMLLTILPIFATTKLMMLTTTEETEHPKV